MRPEAITGIRNRPILFIESKKAQEAAVDYGCYFAELNREDFRLASEVPSNLLETMEKGSIELAIIHPNQLIDLMPIIEAHRAGKKIVVITREPATTREILSMNEQFEQAGLTTVKKQDNYPLDALKALSSLVQEDNI